MEESPKIDLLALMNEIDRKYKKDKEANKIALSEAATQIYGIYDAFVTAGFDETQAFQLVLTAVDNHL